jgi:hypothetical protein
MAFFKKRQPVTRLPVEPEVLEALYPSMRNQLTASSPSGDAAIDDAPNSAKAEADIDRISASPDGELLGEAAATAAGAAGAAAAALLAQPATTEPDSKASTSIEQLVDEVEDTVELSQTSRVVRDVGVSATTAPDEVATAFEPEADDEIVLDGDPYPAASAYPQLADADNGGWSDAELAALAAVANEPIQSNVGSTFFSDLELERVPGELDSLATPTPQWNAPAVGVPTGAARMVRQPSGGSTPPASSRREVMRQQIERTRQSGQDALSEAHKLRMEAARLNSQAEWQTTRNQGARVEAARRLGDLRPGVNRAISETSRSRAESARLTARAKWCTERAAEARKLAMRLLGDADRMQRELDSLGS